MSIFERKEEELGVCLNGVQKEAVLHEEGKPLLLLASPGSGKTMTMIMRLGYLIEERGEIPERLLAVTFSKAAATDMTERFDRFFPQSNGKPNFSTIHSMCFRVVREWAAKENMPYVMIEGSVQNKRLQKQNILSRIYKAFTGEWLSEDIRDELNTHITYIKNRMLNKKEIAELAKGFEYLDLIYEEYENFKQSQSPRLLDFDDMLTLANEIFENDEALLTKYQSMYDHVLVDESQDTSVVQYEVISKLSEQHLNLFMVGDDDQSIFGWRGSFTGLLLDFKSHYPTAKTLFLEQNYRSTKEIVDVSNKFIKRNEGARYNKDMFTENSTGKEIKLCREKTYEEQLYKVVNLVKKESNLKEVAVLFRNTASAIPLIHLLDKEGIPFYQKDETNRFFNHFILKDIKNYCRLSYGGIVGYASILGDIIPRFRGYISRPELKKVEDSYPKEMNLWDAILKLDLPDYKEKFIKKAKRIIPKLKDMTPAKAIKTIRTDLEYNYVIKSYAKFSGRNEDVLVQTLDTIERMAQGLPTLTDFFNELERLEQVVSDSRFNLGENVVTLSTLHSSKGLEFEKVCMMDLQADIIPSPSDFKGDKSLIEEAGRLFYVGMTRAKKELTMFHFGRASESSIFYREVETLIKEKTKGEKLKEAQVTLSKGNSHMKEGVRVVHRSFGQGVVQEVTDEVITIRFKDKVRRIGKDFFMQSNLLDILEE